MSKKLISIVVPVYNEENNVKRAYEAIVAELTGRNDVDFEVIFTDNHSQDKTFTYLQEIAAADNRIVVLRFSRNFGFNRSILAGYRVARGDAAIQIDCDLEDPPAVFHEFINLWQQGHDVVVGVRALRHEALPMVLARKAFYRLLDRMSDTPQQLDAGDFRLVDRSVLDQLRAIDDAQPYVRGLISELARKQGSVRYQRDKRQFGESKFPLRQLVKLGLEGIYAHSTVPLQIATYIGIVIALLTTVITGGYIIGRLISSEAWPAGFATTTVLMLFGISLNALFLGIIGEYIARIYRQVRRRPTVIVEKALNIDVAGALYKEERHRGF